MALYAVMKMEIQLMLCAKHTYIMYTYVYIYSIGCVESYDFGTVKVGVGFLESFPTKKATVT